MYERSQVIELVVKMITKQQSKSQVKTRTIFFLFCAACSVLFDSLQSHRPQPTKLLCLWYFPGRNTEVGCQFLLQGICLTQGLNPRLLHQQGDSLPLHYLARTQFSSVQSLSCVQLLVTPWTVTCQAPLSIGFSRQEYWSGLPFPSPGDLPDPGIDPRSPALQADSLPSEPPGKPL